jgi:hypothetical protein
LKVDIGKGMDNDGAARAVAHIHTRAMPPMKRLLNSCVTVKAAQSVLRYGGKRKEKKRAS